MADEPYVLDGQVYQDETAAMVANHPHIPDDIKRIYITGAEDSKGPLGTSAEAPSALKTQEGTQVAPAVTPSPEPSYDTPLNPAEQAVYSTRFGPQDSKDYDMQGWFKANPTTLPNAEGVHYPDTFKKPNHPTFSDQSMYHGEANRGGSWTVENGQDVFTPSELNLKNMPREDMQDYFNRVEKGVKLNLPDVRPEPYGLNPPEQGPGFKTDRGEPQVLFKTKTGIEITNHDIEDAMGVAMGAGPGTLTEGGGKLANFLKTYEKEQAIKPGVKESTVKLDPTDKALLQIQDVLDGHKVEGTWTPETSPSYQAMVKNKAAKLDIVPNDPIEASNQYHQIYNEQGSTAAIKFAHKVEDKLGNTWHWDAYEGHVNDASKHPGSKAFATKTDSYTYGYTPDQWNSLLASEKHQIIQEHQPVKKSSGFDYEQMNHGGYEVFDPITGKTHAKVDTEAEAKALVKQYNTTADPSSVQVPFSEKEWGPTSEVVNHDYYDNLVDSVIAKAKKSPKDKFKEAVEQIHEDLNTTLAQIKSGLLEKIRNKAPEVLPKVTPTKQAFEKGYTEPAYRGVNSYSPANPVYNFAQGYGEHYSSNSPMLADMYSSFLNEHPRKGKEFEREGSYKIGSQVMPLLIDTRDYHYYDAKGKDWQKANNIAMQEARDLKKKGVIVDNVHDEPGSTRNLTPKKVFITFPSGIGTVKSRFAKDFNPSSPNMLHMIPVIGVGGAAGYVATQDKE